MRLYARAWKLNRLHLPPSFLVRDILFILQTLCVILKSSASIQRGFTRQLPLRCMLTLCITRVNWLQLDVHALEKRKWFQGLSRGLPTKIPTSNRSPLVEVNVSSFPLWKQGVFVASVVLYFFSLRNNLNCVLSSSVRFLTSYSSKPSILSTWSGQSKRHL